MKYLTTICAASANIDIMGGVGGMENTVFSADNEGMRL